VPPPDRELLRKLADWPTAGVPVTSLYVDADGRRHPRRADVERQAESLLRKALDAAGALKGEGHRSACRDRRIMGDFLREGFDRKGTRGLALFSSAGAGLWHEQPLPVPVRDRAVIRPRPYLLPLEALVERADAICTALVDRQRARLWVTRLGEIEEITSLLDDVPGRHDQGGWAQARLQRHVEDHVLRHLKRVAETLLRLREGGRFDHLVLSGPDEVIAELERELHDYVRRAVVERASLPVGAPVADVLDHALGVERRLERERERSTVRRLVAEAAAPEGRGALGGEPTLEALPAARVDTLVVLGGLAVEGRSCPSCGRLAVGRGRCPACGSTTVPQPDLIEEAVEVALRNGARVETIPRDVEGAEDLAGAGGIGALLRF
jgi:peptide chain release factor subunit 1